MQKKPFRHFAAVALVACALAAGSAQARDVLWSVGIAAAPGVSIGVSNAQPVYVAPAPIYVAPQPVYLAPRRVYLAPPPVVLVQSAPVYYGHPGKRKGWHKHHHRHHRHWH